MVKYGDFQLGEIRYVGLGGETELQIAPVVGRPDHRVDPYVSKMEVKGNDALLTVLHPHTKAPRTMLKVPGYAGPIIFREYFPILMIMWDFSLFFSGSVGLHATREDG